MASINVQILHAIIEWLENQSMPDLSWIECSKKQLYSFIKRRVSRITREISKAGSISV